MTTHTLTLSDIERGAWMEISSARAILDSAVQAYHGTERRIAQRRNLETARMVHWKRRYDDAKQERGE